MCVSCLLNMTPHWGSNNCNRIRYASWNISYIFCISQGQRLWFMDGKCTQHIESTYCLSLHCHYCLLEKYWLWKNITLFNIIVPAKGGLPQYTDLWFQPHVPSMCVFICVVLNECTVNVLSIYELCGFVFAEHQVVILPFAVCRRHVSGKVEYF